MLVYASFLWYSCTFEIWCTMLFPGKLYCYKSSRKLIQHAISTFEHYWKWRGGGWRAELNNLAKVWGVALLFTIYSIFLDIKEIDFYIKKSIPFLDIRTSFFDLKKSISWYQTIDSWNQKIALIKKSDWFFYIIDFVFISRNGSSGIDFWYHEIQNE